MAEILFVIPVPVQDPPGGLKPVKLNEFDEIHDV